MNVVMQYKKIVLKKMIFLRWMVQNFLYQATRFQAYFTIIAITLCCLIESCGKSAKILIKHVLVLEFISKNILIST